MNFGKLVDYGTVEFRQHQGTYNVTTAVNWAKLMHRITSRSWNPKHSKIDLNDFPVTVDGLADFLGLGQNRLRAWMKRRVRHFGFEGLARDQPQTARPTEEASCETFETAEHLQNEIILQIENNENLYRRIRALEPRGAVTIERVKRTVENWAIATGWEHNFRLSVFDAVDWEYITLQINLGDIAGN